MTPITKTTATRSTPARATKIDRERHRIEARVEDRAAFREHLSLLISVHCDEMPHSSDALDLLCLYRQALCATLGVSTDDAREKAGSIVGSLELLGTRIGVEAMLAAIAQHMQNKRMEESPTA